MHFSFDPREKSAKVFRVLIVVHHDISLCVSSLIFIMFKLFFQTLKLIDWLYQLLPLVVPWLQSIVFQDILWHSERRSFGMNIKIRLFVDDSFNFFWVGSKVGYSVKLFLHVDKVFVSGSKLNLIALQKLLKKGDLLISFSNDFLILFELMLSQVLVFCLKFLNLISDLLIDLLKFLPSSLSWVTFLNLLKMLLLKLLKLLDLNFVLQLALR